MTKAFQVYFYLATRPQSIWALWEGHVMSARYFAQDFPIISTSRVRSAFTAASCP
jgi:hypothetical protein